MRELRNGFLWKAEPHTEETSAWPVKKPNIEERGAFVQATKEEGPFCERGDRQVALPQMASTQKAQ